MTDGLLHQIFGPMHSALFALRGTPSHRSDCVGSHPKSTSAKRKFPALSSTPRLQPHPSAIAALSTTGYRLERGRLCFLKRQIYLHLVYTKDGDEWSVYLRPRGSESLGSSVREASVGSEDLAYFQTGRLTAVTVARRGAVAFAVQQRLVLQ